MSKLDPYNHLKISLNPDGTLTRHHTLSTAAATAGHSVLSKDVTLDAGKKTWVRIYLPARLPSNDTTVARLPIIFFFPGGGGWIRASIADATTHESCNRISAEVPAVLVAAQLRLAPESRLPAQYEDAADAVAWARDQAADTDGGDQWIRDYADFSRCYLYGVGCGANVAYNAALRLQEVKLHPMKIAGTILNQPFFGAKQRSKSEVELAEDDNFPLPVQDLLWELALPVGTDRDHRFSNPFVEREKVKQIGRCLVIGFGGDPLIDRQQELVKMLAEEGVTVEARFDDAGFHGVDMVDSKRATAVLNFIKTFV